MIQIHINFKFNRSPKNVVHPQNKSLSVNSKYKMDSKYVFIFQKTQFVTHEVYFFPEPLPYFSRTLTLFSLSLALMFIEPRTKNFSTIH